MQLTEAGVTFKLNGYHNPVRELLLSKFERHLVGDTLGWDENIAYDEDGKRLTPYLADENLRTEIHKDHDRLVALSDAEVAVEYDQLKKQLFEDQDKAQWYNQPRFRADFEHWAKMPFWTVEEGLILLAARDPDQVSMEKVAKLSDGFNLYSSLKKSHDIAARCIIEGRLKPQNSPKDFLSWATGINLEIPQELTAALTEFSQTDTDGGNTGEPEIQQNDLPGSAKDSDKRYVRTLHKLIVAMAVDCYGFSPNDKRSTVVKDVGDALAKVGLALSEDTIRATLRDTAKYLPPDYDEQ